MKSERAEVPVDELLAMKAPYNPRTIEPHAMERLRASIRELGCGEPVTLNRRSPAKGWPAGSTPVIVGGHQRVEAARLEGWKTFPVFWGDWTDAEEIELNVALNNPNLQGRFDDELLKGALALARSAGSDLALTGFTEAEIVAIEGDNLAGLAADEWVGMPEFTTTSKEAFKQIMCHFVDQAAVDAFARAVGKEVTEGTRYIWFPEQVIERYADKAYVSDAEDSEA